MMLFYLGLAGRHRPGPLAGLDPPLPVLGLLTISALVAVLLWRQEPGPRLAALCALDAAGWCGALAEDNLGDLSLRGQ
jgi:hypothetical protein